MKTPEIITHLVHLAGNVADAYTSALFRLDPKTNALTPHVFMTLSQKFNETVSIPMGHSPIGKAALTGDAVIIENFKDDFAKLKIYKSEENLKSFIAVPVIDKNDKVLGVLSLDSKQSYNFSPKLLKIIIGFTEQIAVQMHREDEENQGGGKVWPFFRELGTFSRFVAESPQFNDLSQRLLQIPPEIFVCDAIAVVEFEEGHFPGKIRAHRGFIQDLGELLIEEGKGLVGSCAKTKTSVLIENAAQRKLALFNEIEDHEPFMSYAAIPLVIKEQLRGVLFCANRAPRSISQDDVDRLGIIGASAGVALYCAETRQKAQYQNSVDIVTGAPNYRFLVENRESVQREFFLDNKPVFFLLMRLPKLTSIYENHGADCADQLLRQLMSLLSRSAPSPKFIFRYSDNAFLLVLLDRTREEVLSLEGRLRHVFDNNQFYSMSIALDLRVEMGLSAFPADGKNLTELTGLAYGRASKTLAETT
jgi:diguanylate cyclase (GGDEF)-like protein